MSALKCTYCYESFWSYRQPFWLLHCSSLVQLLEWNFQITETRTIFMSGATKGLGKWYGRRDEINYPGIKLCCTGQTAVRGSSTIKISNTQKTHIVQCHSSWCPNSLLEGEPGGGMWLEYMPIKWYGIAYEQKVVWHMPHQPHRFCRPCMLFSSLTYSLPLNTNNIALHT